ncbi:hypothetical protein QF038_003236 [Pseudarthrobacter sp. W1I19]|uniref:glycoside hydrolase family 16 protein n=1 Tax=Pseudarthrobacter sp. W1I19 TaxID=3042288 RepID=UPI00277D6CA2|nr:glycoside hydrolase family 16 protein [Pseudarthrobacter sp. W1I19]MDQ0924728.1 hypothetical protein [Pseudarthrobacter sp. W1I19]
MIGFRTIEAGPARADSAEKSRRRMQARPVVLTIVLSVLAYGSLSFVSDSSPVQANINPPSGEAMPIGNLPGWKQVFTEDFVSGNVPVGEFPGGMYGAKWSENYADGTPDTAAQLNEARSGYFPSRVLSVKDGVLDMYLHSENGTSMGAAPSPKFSETSGRPYNSQVYGRYSVRFKADPLPGYKTAWLLWPDSKQWPEDGEIDFPEGDLAATIFAAMHGTGSAEGELIDMFHTTATFSSWHTATIEWNPGRVEFFLDGRSIGISTTSTPDKPMHYILQTESCLPVCPAPETSGHLYVDWVAIWEKS